MPIYFDHEKALAFARWSETILERCRFFDIARGSGLECAACLDLLLIKHLINEQELDEGKSLLKDIVSLLVGLIRNNSGERLHEDPVPSRANDHAIGTYD